MKLKIVTSTILFALVLGLAGLAAAQETEQALSEPNFTPDSSLYSLQTAGESMSMAFTFSDERKAEKRLTHAERRISEVKMMRERDRDDLANRSDERYTEQINQSQEHGQNIAELAREQEIEDVISEATSIHVDTLEEVNPQEPGFNAKRKAEDVTVETERDNVRKVEKQADKAVENRVTEADRLSQVEDSDRAVEAAELYEDEMDELEEIEEQIQDPGERRQAGEIVARATQRHQETLSEVHERVPEEAKEAIDRAMQKSAQGHERAVNMIQETGELPDDIQSEIPADAEEYQRETPDQGTNGQETGRPN